MKKLIVMVIAAAVTAAVFAPAVMAEDFYYKKAAVNDDMADLVKAEKDVYAEKDSKTGFWLIGAGAAVDRLPLTAAKFSLPMFYFAYESIYKKMLGTLDFSWSIGFYDLMPELEFAVLMPMKPFDIRISAGGYYDLIIGGAAGMLVKLGVILNKTVQFDLLMIPIGTQPTISYQDLISTGKKIDVSEAANNGLKFPIFGVLLSIRI